MLQIVNTTGVLSTLQALGLTEWESKTYLALLEDSPATGYAIAKRAGIARSKIYEVLASLVARNVVGVSRSEPQLYGPIPPRQLVSRLRTQFNENLDRAEEALVDYASGSEVNSVIWDIQGRSAILERARTLVNQAENRLLIEIWAQDVDALAEHLAEAIARGVRVIVVGYGDVSLPGADVFPHPATDTVTSGLGGRWLVVSMDDREVVAGNVSAGAHSRAAWTSHPGLVVPITELVRHDLYKLEMLNAHGPVLEATFGPALGALRDKYRPLT